MTNVRLVLYKNKSTQQDSRNLYIRITQNRKPKYISLGIEVDPDKDWDHKSQRVKKCFPNSSRVNNFISKKLSEAHAYALDLDSAGLIISRNKLKYELEKKPAESFIAFGNLQIERWNKLGQIRTSIRYTAIINKLVTFLDGKPFTFDDFTVAFLHDYQAHLISIGNHPNTVHTNLKTLRALLYIAIREDRFPQEKNPFFRFKLKTVPTIKERLSMDEIKKIAGLDLPDNKKIFHVRNAFLFSFYCAGIRVGDLIQLKWENITDTLNYQMGKTKRFRRMKLVHPSKEIISLYRKKKAKPSDYIFPFFKSDVDYSIEKFRMQQLASQAAVINNNLKKIAALAEIPKKITSHVARHSFADYARQTGMSIYDISKALGHSSISITEAYLSNFDDQSLDDAMGKLFE